MQVSGSAANNNLLLGLNYKHPEWNKKDRFWMGKGQRPMAGPWMGKWASIYCVRTSKTTELSRGTLDTASCDYLRRWWVLSAREAAWRMPDSNKEFTALLLCKAHVRINPVCLQRKRMITPRVWYVLWNFAWWISPSLRLVCLWMWGAWKPALCTLEVRLISPQHQELLNKPNQDSGHERRILFFFTRT